jgi:2'-5' RNA ligase
MRLFVALELPELVRGELADWRDDALDRVEGLRPVEEQGLHATLCFLGGRPEEELEAIGEAVRLGTGDAGPPPLALGEAMWLPRSRPRVLAVALEDAAGELGDLQACVGAALEAAGVWRPERRPFLGHVTVARVRSRERVRPIELPLPPALRFEGAAVVLYRSHISRLGARYEPLRRVVLAGRV